MIFAAGLAVLIYSSDWLIQGSVRLSLLLKLSPLFVGMVIVAFGTSMPEAGVGIMAALRNYKGIALGNVIGSNISNIGLILGICALFQSFSVDKNIFKRELPFMMGGVVLLYLLSLDFMISRADGLILLCGFIAFLAVSYRGARLSFNHPETENFQLKRSVQAITLPSRAGLIIVASLIGLVWGADLMVKSGAALARIWGVRPWLIGVTIFAVGTSLPELAASLTAAFRKLHSISIGNIVGSNIFNILFVVGIVALIRPLPVEPSYLGFEYMVLLLVSFALVWTMKTEYTLTRKEGFFLLSSYVLFIFFLLLRK